MNTPESNNNMISLNKNQKIILAVLAALSIILAVMAMTPSVRIYFQSKFNTPERVILSKVSGPIASANKQYLIFKIKEGGSLIVEIYEMSADGNSQSLKQKFILDDDLDAYVMIDKNTTNLALSDVDKDGSLEIVVPSVDRNGNSRLNTFKYDTDIQSFTPYTKPE